MTRADLAAKLREQLQWLENSSHKAGASIMRRDVAYRRLKGVIESAAVEFERDVEEERRIEELEARRDEWA